MSKDDLKAKAISALRRLQKLPDIVLRFSGDPKLSLYTGLTPGTARRVYKRIFTLLAQILGGSWPPGEPGRTTCPLLLDHPQALMLFATLSALLRTACGSPVPDEPL